MPTTEQGPLAESDEHPIVLFDGVCNLCNGFVQFLIPRDSEGRLRYASLQSEFGQQIRDHAGLSTDDLESVILVDDGLVYTKSDAVIRIGEQLGGIFRVASLGQLVPRRLRDWLYDFVAANRYDWFGQKEQCMLPDDDVSDRFIQ